MMRSVWGTHLATGHYAQIRSGELHKAVDLRKDQSYFLYSIPRPRLAFLFFPLGGMVKDDVRPWPAVLHCPWQKRKTARTSVLFLTGIPGFLGARVSANSGYRPGPFVDESGRVVGEHKGIARYTIGQREGLGIALASLFMSIALMRSPIRSMSALRPGF